MRIQIETPDAPASAAMLMTWLRREDGLDLRNLQQERRAPEAGEMGPELLPIVTAILASPLIAELVKSIFEWLKASRHKRPIKITAGDLTLECSPEDADEMSKIIEKLEALVGDDKRSAE